MLIPIKLLWNVRIQRKKKVAIMSIFSLSLVTIAIAIARVADIGSTEKTNGLPDSTYLWFWSALQASLCIVVACSSAFRQLFTVSAEPKNPAWSPTMSYYERLRSNFRSRDKKKQNKFSPYDISTVTETGDGDNCVMKGEVMGHDSEDIELVTGKSRVAVGCYLAPSAAHLSGSRSVHNQ
ncbi:hypothetical protein F5Y03DRAFT_380094 [Xylaria venustula]|nr:hypothetical protein F5Y03DRAFT_380094 [Xylaria venustula]